MDDSFHYPAGIPLIPAPFAFFALMFGLMLGIGIGRRRAIMHGAGMQGMHGMHGGGECGGPMMMRKKMMMGGMMGPMGMMGGMHHHHGDGMPECRCDEGGESRSRDWEHADSE